MKNRKREICTSGSVRDEDGQPPHLLGRRNFLHLAAGAAALPAVSRFAWAQGYPSRPVRYVVSAPPAGAQDILARLIGEWLSARLGQPFVVENRPGGGTNIGTEMVVRASPDGIPVFRTKAIRIAANWFRLPDKEKPRTEEGCRVLFGYPSSLLDGERRLQGVAKRPPLPAEMSDALSVTSNATIVCSIPDSLIRLSLPTPRAAIGVAAGAGL